MDVVSLAAEYPNDNPALHCGVIWVCRTTTGRAEPELPELIVEELEPLDASVFTVCAEPPPPAASGILPASSRDSSVLPPAPADAFTVLVSTLADVALGAGAANVAAVLPGLLHDGRVDEVDVALGSALRARGVCDARGVAPSFVAITSAWRAILRGTSEDFDACGGTMLDQWAAELLAGLLGRPASSLRSELRTRGVAAFGLTSRAADAAAA